MPWLLTAEFLHSSAVAPRCFSHHVVISYMGASVKMMADSRLGDVLIENGASASESINQAMNGSHYNSAMRVYKRMADALERLM